MQPKPWDLLLHTGEGELSRVPGDFGIVSCFIVISIPVHISGVSLGGEIFGFRFEEIVPRWR